METPRVNPWYSALRVNKIDKPIIELGAEDEWDGGGIHDPYPLIYKGKIWLFYKGESLGDTLGNLKKGINQIVRAQGVAMADEPEGPFVKSPVNPILNSGHETCLFPYKEGIAAILILDGPEKNTVQYAPDGINFEIKAIIQCPPVAPRPYCLDAFADNGNGKGITWGLCHIAMDDFGLQKEGNIIIEKHSFIARFDCDLHRNINRLYFKQWEDQIGRFD